MAAYLLFALAPQKDTRDYETRLDEAYNKYEKVVLQIDADFAPDLLDLATDVTSEAASVYTEVGMQAEILLVTDIIKNVLIEKP